MIMILPVFALLAFQNQDYVINEQLRVEYVLLDLVAYQKSGDMVTDLKASDFEVKEGKKEVEVTYFDILDFRNLEPGRAPSQSVGGPVGVAERVEEGDKVHQIIVALDLAYLRSQQKLKAFSQLKEFFQRLDGSSLRYKLQIYDLTRGSVTDGFVESPALALEALSRFEVETKSSQQRYSGSSGRRTAVDWGEPTSNFTSRNQKGGMLVGTGNTLEDLERIYAECVDSRSFDPYLAKDCITSTMEAFLEEHLARTEDALGQLELLAYKFQDLKGLKSMFLVSPGFNLSGFRSVGQLTSHYLKLVDGDSTSGRGNITSNRPVKANTSTDYDFNRVIHACIKNRVVFNVFDIFNDDNSATEFMTGMGPGGSGRMRGNAATSDPFQGTFTGIGFLYNDEVMQGSKKLAEDSGGEFFQSFHLASPMEKVLEKNTFFYALGYDSPPGKPGKYRKIKVKVKRRGVKVRHRQGYYGGVK